MRLEGGELTTGISLTGRSREGGGQSMHGDLQIWQSFITFDHEDGILIGDWEQHVGKSILPSIVSAGDGLIYLE